MKNYLLKRVFLLPLTLFIIVLVNFIILNLAPNEPTSLMQKSVTGEAQRTADDAHKQDHQYLQFREHFGLTLPILFNLWPQHTVRQVSETIDLLVTQKESMSAAKHHALRIYMGDKARFIMPLLIEIAEKPGLSLDMRKEVLSLFIRGGTKQGIVKPKLTAEEKVMNRSIAEDNLFLQQRAPLVLDDEATLFQKQKELTEWFKAHEDQYSFSLQKKISIFFLETRLARYFSKIATLDFGHIREDRNKTVISEVSKRIKYSLTLALLPMIVTFFLSLLFGMVMARYQHHFLDYTLNLLFLFLFAIPIFVAAPFLIEKIAMHTPSLPYSGFTSPQEIYYSLTSFERLQDIARHICLPLVALIYSSLAVQARLARTAFLEVMRQDYIRFAQAKGIKKRHLFVRHIGRAGSITIITSLAGSLGVVLGGSLIVETIFEINGFGRFFYEAIVQRDYNVVLFSAFAGSLLTLVGFLLADISYTILDPRITLE